MHMRQPPQKLDGSLQQMHTPVTNKGTKKAIKIDYQGITLKEYFQRCEQYDRNGRLQRIEEESCYQSKQSLPQTPFFVANDSIKPTKCIKMKTETHNQEQENCIYYRNNLIKNVPKVYQEGPHRQLIDKIKKSQNHVKDTSKKKVDRLQKTMKPVRLQKIRYNKRMLSNPSKVTQELQNRTTLNTFYQIDDRYRGRKMRTEKDQNSNSELKLTDIFMITNYKSRFH